MGHAEELGNLHEMIDRARDDARSGDTDVALGSFGQAAEYARAGSERLRAEGAPVGTLLPWDMNLIFALSSLAGLKFMHGKSHDLTESLQLLRDHMNNLDFEDIQGVTFGYCTHNRITSDDSTCLAKPPC